jgi:hypothetical protein
LDKQDALCVSERQPIAFQVEGAELVGPETIAAEAGVASIVVRLSPSSTGFSVNALSPGNSGLGTASIRWDRNDAGRASGLLREVSTIAGK